MSLPAELPDPSKKSEGQNEITFQQQCMAEALFQSLLGSPLFVDQLPESATFDRSSLSLPDPVPSLNFSQKLGHLCEDALAALLDHSPAFELLERNLVIRKSPQETVGELDFLLREASSGKLLHLELATKFYLVVPTAQGLLLPGPDARDHYFRKLNRLQDHQLTLPSRYREFLPSAYRNEAIATRHLILGCLFDHFEARTAHQPEFLHPEARRGKWLTSKELPAHFPDPATLRVIPKPLWPVPVEELKDLELTSFALDSPVERCLMVVTPEGFPLFITPSDYPEAALTQCGGVR